MHASSGSRANTHCIQLVTSYCALPANLNESNTFPGEILIAILDACCLHPKGPMWVNANAIACYGLAQYGMKEQALKIAHRVTKALADDLRNSSGWHEAYATNGVSRT